MSAVLLHLAAPKWQTSMIETLENLNLQTFPWGMYLDHPRVSLFSFKSDWNLWLGDWLIGFPRSLLGAYETMATTYYNKDNDKEDLIFWDQLSYRSLSKTWQEIAC